MYSACPKCQRSPSTTSAASVSQPISDRGSRSNELARNLLHPSAAANAIFRSRSSYGSLVARPRSLCSAACLVLGARASRLAELFECPGADAILNVHMNPAPKPLPRLTRLLSASSTVRVGLNARVNQFAEEIELAGEYTFPSAGSRVSLIFAYMVRRDLPPGVLANICCRGPADAIPAYSRLSTILRSPNAFATYLSGRKHILRQHPYFWMPSCIRRYPFGGLRSCVSRTF